MTTPFGYHYRVDARGIDAKRMTAKHVRDFFEALAPAIGMTIWRGQDMHPMIASYGSDPSNAGVTGFCPILTSNFSIHCVDATGCMDLDVFSCKQFKKSVVDRVVCEFFMPRVQLRTTFDVR